MNIFSFLMFTKYYCVGCMVSEIPTVSVFGYYPYRYIYIYIYIRSILLIACFPLRILVHDQHYHSEHYHSQYIEGCAYLESGSIASLQRTNISCVCI